MIQDSKLLSIKFSLNGLNSRVPAIIDAFACSRSLSSIITGMPCFDKSGVSQLSVVFWNDIHKKIYTAQRLHQITVISYGDYIFIITLKVSVCAEYPFWRGRLKNPWF